MKNSGVMILSLAIGYSPLGAQESLDFEQLIERNFGFQEEDQSYEELYDQLFAYYLHPLDLNKASREELRAISVLSEQEIQAILDFRNINGPFISILELQGIPEFSPEVIRVIDPFLKVTRHHPPGTLAERVENTPTKYLLLRYGRAMQKKSGFLNKPGVGKAYYGTMDHLYAKFRLSKPGDFSLGLTVEKDPGEPLKWDLRKNIYYFDFHSFHLMVENRSRIRKLLIGDFQIQSGQGLINGGGFQLGKGTEPIRAVRRSNLGILPYSSATESGFYRGAAIEIDLRPLQVLSYYSHQKRDASLIVLDAEEHYSSLRTTGLHRTSSEIESRKNLRENVAGQLVQYQSRDQTLIVGLQTCYWWYQLDKLNSTRPYQKFDVTTPIIWNVGGFLSYQWQNFNFFGEWVESAWGGSGALAGIIASLGRQLDISFQIRNYQPNFIAPNGRAFGENSRNQNEAGLYWGLSLKPIRGITLNAYYDRFQYKWLRFGVDAPSEGYETVLAADVNLGPETRLQISWRKQQKDKNLVIPGSKLNDLQPGKKQNAMVQLTHSASSVINLKSRVQWSLFEFGNSRTSGFLLAQDLNLDFGKFKISTRLALFDVDDFDNRQYVYERHVLYRVSFPFFQDRGMRSYANFQFKIFRKIDLWLRYARTVFRNQDTVGSGLDQISGNSQSDVTAQIMWKL